MKNIYTFTILILITVSASAQDKWQWAVSGGSSGSGTTSLTDERVYDIAVDEDGNAYVLGTTLSNSTFGPNLYPGHGQMDIFIAKYSCAGALEWAEVVGSGLEDRSGGVAIDSRGYIYFSGRVRTDNLTNVYFGDSIYPPQDAAFIIKYDSSGKLHKVWLSEVNAHGIALAIDNKNNVYSFGGSFTGELAPGFPVNYGFHIAKFDSSFSLHSIVLNMDSTTNFFGAKFEIDDQNNFYISGRYDDSLKIGNTILTATNQSGKTGFIAKYDQNGNFVWARQLISDLAENLLGLAVRDNALYITGGGSKNMIFGQDTLKSNSSSLGYLAKYDLDGNALWGRTATSPYGFGGADIELDKSGEYVYFSGNYPGWIDFGTVYIQATGQTDIFLAKYDTAGNFIHAVNLPTTGSQHDLGLAVALDGAGNAIVGGKFTGTMYYGDNNSDSIMSIGGSRDMFVAKYGNELCTDTTTIGIKEIASPSAINIYPNPGNDGFYISTTDQWQQVEVYDPVGRLVLSQNISTRSEYVSLPQHSNGLYIIVLKRDGERDVRKWMRF